MGRAEVKHSLLLQNESLAVEYVKGVTFHYATAATKKVATSSSESRGK
jgi:hypothetical protein